MTTLIILSVLVVGYLMIATEHVNHISRAAIAMFTGVIAWLLYMLRGGTFLKAVHPDTYYQYLDGTDSSPGLVKRFIADHIIGGYIGEACSVILFLIATNTIVEVMSNNGVFDPIVKYLRMKSAKRFLWIITLTTFIFSANIDNTTTVILMLSLVGQIVRSRSQLMVYACAIMLAANLGGSTTVIGDMTTLMLWVHVSVTPSTFFLGMIIPALATLVVFNLLVGKLLYENVELHSFIHLYDGDDSPLSPAQKYALLIIGIAGLWSIPTFHSQTGMPPFIGALCVLTLIWAIEGLFNMERNGSVRFVQRKHYRNTEFFGMKIVIYYIGITLGIGALKETGAIDGFSTFMTDHFDNVYVFGGVLGLLSSVFDNVPLTMFGMHTIGESVPVNDIYWQILSFSCAIGGSALMIGSMAGHSIMQVENIRVSWFFRRFTWRVVVASIAGFLIFWLMHR